VVESAWACWKGILIENFKKIKKQEKQQQLFFLLGVTENGITQKNVFLILFKFDKLAEDYHLLLSSKPLEGDFFLFKKY
jgi:hypothetical protein